MAHRLCWVIFHGAWPSYDIDHIDLEKTNNAISNLREASRSQNCANKPMQSNNKSGVKGVHFCNRQKQWVASLTVGRKRKFIGYFDRKEDAGAAYAKRAKEIFGEFARIQ